MATKKKSAIPAENLDLYERLIATNPAIERKGDVHPYTSINGRSAGTSTASRRSQAGCPAVNEQEKKLLVM
jgi:hypothetical protein